MNRMGKKCILAIWLCLDEAGGAHWQHLKSMCVTALVLCAVQDSLCFGCPQDVETSADSVEYALVYR